MEKITTEKCGCEFLNIWDEQGNSMCVLSKCRCQEHYDEQLVADWYDKHGDHHHVVRGSGEVPGLLPLEVN